MQHVIDQLTALGWKPNGRSPKRLTPVGHRRLKMVWMGGRLRYKLPGTGQRITIGPVSVCHYSMKGYPRPLRLKTRDPELLQRLTELTAA